MGFHCQRKVSIIKIVILSKILRRDFLLLLWSVLSVRVKLLFNCGCRYFVHELREQWAYSLWLILLLGSN